MSILKPAPKGLQPRQMSSPQLPLTGPFESKYCIHISGTFGFRNNLIVSCLTHAVILYLEYFLPAVYGMVDPQLFPTFSEPETAPATVPVCVKQKAFINGSQVVLRGCWFTKPELKDECRDVIYDGVRAKECVCLTDKCNDASAMSATLLFPLTVVAAVVSRF